MRFVDNNGVTDPHLNLAFEEYLLRREDQKEPLLLFYVENRRRRGLKKILVQEAPELAAKLADERLL